jgi:predicted anti-sigma-YlaC factor YlaD
MNCNDVEELVQRQLDGESAAPGADLDQHLAQCEPCRELIAAAQVLAEGLEATRQQPVHLPNFFSAQITRVVIRDQRQRLLQRRILSAGAMAAAACIMVAGWWLVHHDGSDGGKNLAAIVDRPNGPAAGADANNVAASSRAQAVPGNLFADAMTVIEGVPLIEVSSGPANDAATSARTGLSHGVETARGTTGKALRFLSRDGADGPSAR